MRRVTFTATLVVALIIPILSQDPTASSKWYRPSAGSVKSPSLQTPVAYSSYDRSIQDNSNRPSSFVPTDGMSAGNYIQSTGNTGDTYYSNNQDAAPLYNASEANPYQYLQYNPEEQSYSIYPTTGTIDRQEFPSGNGLIPTGDGDGGSFFDNLPSIGGITSGITGTASSIAQGIGLGSLGIFGSLLVLIVGAPLIVFAILFPAAVLVIAILGFPVLQVTLPPSDPFLGRKLKSGLFETARKAREVLLSEECMERVSCEMARKARQLPYENRILEAFVNTNNTLLQRLSKSVKIGRSGEDCERFKCLQVTNAVTKIQNMYNTFRNATK